MTALAWVSVVVLHDEARWVGGGWMLFGIVAYVIYRRGFEGTSLTGRVEVPEEALVKDVPAAQYREILVPVFGTKLDDDIVGTAGRLAAQTDTNTDGELAPRLTLVYVIDLPLKVPLNSRPPADRMEVAEASLARAEEVAAEYETVETSTVMARSRSVGAGIVETARSVGSELIVMGGEPPTRIKGGAMLGGIGGERPPQIGPVTEYVLRKAPSRVLITAPRSDGSEVAAVEAAGEAVPAVSESGSAARRE
jgi:APA family basic amino acid/polyamine antiporter